MKYIKKVVFLIPVILIVIAISYIVTKNKNSLVNYEAINGKVLTDNIANESYEEYYEKAEVLLENMSLEEKVSQIFIIRCPSVKSNELVEKYNLGGYILFAKDFEGKTKDEVKNMIKGFQEKSKIPMIIAVDEEGGSVCRVSLNSNLRETKFKSPQELYKEGGLERIYEDTIEKSRLLKELGINMNLAPVADVSTNSNDYIYKRSFGKNATETCKYVETVIKAMKSENVVSTLKHFPGYGNNIDSHKEVAYDNRNIDTFKNKDFLPFKTGIDNGVESILVSHNVVNSIDSKYPASLSKKMHEILRKDLSFDGMIITDDLDMEGVKRFANAPELAIKAVEAGNDLIITSKFEEQREAVINAVKEGKISEDTINKTVKRIIEWKLRER